MADERLRTLERRWASTGAVEDEAAYLQELVRVGALDAELLALAAHLGRPAARLACAPTPPVAVERGGYECAPRYVEEPLLVGLADAPRAIVERLSPGYLAAAWDRCRRGVQEVGLDPRELVYGGIGGPLWIEPELPESPFLGFGWVGRGEPRAELVERLDRHLRAGEPALFAAQGTKGIHRSVEPFGHVAGLLSLLEWAFDEGPWVELLAELGPRPAASPVARILLRLVEEARTPRHLGHPTPFTPGAPRPLRELLLPELLPTVSRR